MCFDYSHVLFCLPARRWCKSSSLARDLGSLPYTRHADASNFTVGQVDAVLSAVAADRFTHAPAYKTMVTGIDEKRAAFLYHDTIDCRMVHQKGQNPPQSCMKRFYFKQRDVAQLSAKDQPQPQKFGSPPAIGPFELIAQYQRYSYSNFIFGRAEPCRHRFRDCDTSNLKCWGSS